MAPILLKDFLKDFSSLPVKLFSSIVVERPFVLATRVIVWLTLALFHFLGLSTGTVPLFRVLASWTRFSLILLFRLPRSVRGRNGGRHPDVAVQFQ